VSRPQVFTRAATQEDLPTLISLWEELRQVGGRAERAVNPMSAVDIRQRLSDVLLDPDCRIVMACVHDVPMGMAVLQVSQPDPLADGKLLQIVHLVVQRSERHHGIGRALVSAAADFATEQHIDHVATGVYPSLRDANRFYARLGFAPVAVRRIAPVTVLRRRLSQDRAPALLNGSVRRRTRLGRAVPPQRSTRAKVERVKS
jgi:GNAT superfamily N-acetyltransferase